AIGQNQHVTMMRSRLTGWPRHARPYGVVSFTDDGNGHDVLPAGLFRHPQMGRSALIIRRAGEVQHSSGAVMSVHGDMVWLVRPGHSRDRVAYHRAPALGSLPDSGFRGHILLRRRVLVVHCGRVARGWQGQQKACHDWPWAPAARRIAVACAQKCHVFPVAENRIQLRPCRASACAILNESPAGYYRIPNGVPQSICIESPPDAAREQQTRRCSGDSERQGCFPAAAAGHWRTHCTRRIRTGPVNSSVTTRNSRFPFELRMPWLTLGACLVLVFGYLWQGWKLQHGGEYGAGELAWLGANVPPLSLGSEP